MATAETARLIASLELQDKNFTRGLKGVERGIGRVDKKLGAFSGAVNRNVGRAVDNVTARLLEVPGAVISAAVEQETAITGIRKTIEGDVTAITDDLKKLSTETGSTFTELAGIAELGGAMGISKDDISAFVKQVSIIGATTNVSVEEAATAFGQLGTIVGITGDEFDNLAASLVDLGNKGNSTEAQILEIAKRSGAAAKGAGIAKDEFLGWASAAANLALGDELAGTALQKFFVDTQKILARGGEDLTTIGKISGMTGKQFKKAFKKDATGALHSFVAGLKDLSGEQRVLAIEDLFGKGSGMTRLLLGLSEALDDPTSGLTASLKTNAEAWEEGTAAQEEADKRFKTSEFLFKRLGNSVNLAAATIGTELLPVLNDLATEGLEFLSKPATQKGIKDFAVGLGKGIRALAGIVTSINWSAVAGFLSTAAGFAGQLVTWFTKMPDWAQAFLIGGFAVTKLPVIGSIVSELGKGLIKGVLGMTAGVVNINAGVVNGGGGTPVPGGKGGPLAGIGSALKGIVTDFGVAVAGLGLTGVVGLTIAAIAPIALFGLTKAIIDATGKPIPERELEGRQETSERRGVPKENRPTKPGRVPAQGLQGDWLKGWTERNSNLQPTIETTARKAATDNTAQRNEIIAVRKAVAEAREKEPPRPNRALIEERNAPKPLDKISPPIVKAVSQQKAELGNLKNAMATLNTSTTKQTSAQTAELSNIKNATATLDTNAKAGLTTVSTGITTAAAAAATYSSGNILATGSTTSAVNTNAAATRGVAPPITAAVYAIGASIAATIWAARPVIQSTTVVQQYTTQQRTGSTGGSRNSSGFRTGNI